MNRMKLPLNCQADYIEGFLTKNESEEFYNFLMNEYNISNLKLNIASGDYEANYGKLMFVDEDLYKANQFPQSIWGETAVWPNKLKRIKEKIEILTQKTFQVGVCIFYSNGESGVDYHSDEVAFGDTTIIPSLSLGEEREFKLREKETQKEYSLLLEKGSLLIMGERCQERYEHSLPINANYLKGRINITFRQYGFEN